MHAFNPLAREWCELSGLVLRAVAGDWFQDHRCLACGCHGAVFALVPDGRIVSTCPACVADRIDRIEAELHEVPLSLPLILRVLRAEARREAEGQRTRAPSW